MSTRKQRKAAADARRERNKERGAMTIVGGRLDEPRVALSSANARPTEKQRQALRARRLPIPARRADACIALAAAFFLEREADGGYTVTHLPPGKRPRRKKSTMPYVSRSENKST